MYSVLVQLIALLISLFFVANLASASPSTQAKISQFINNNEAYYNGFYQNLHQNPELSGAEKNTSAKVAEQLRGLGLTVIERIGGYGVVGVLENGPGPIGMLRADMDALPIQEETQLVYKSKVPGVMHACGHDLHTTLLIALAKYFKENTAAWTGTLYFLAQPAEETVTGAKAMLDDGLFNKITKPHYALAIHADARNPVGTVGTHIADTLASSDSVDIVFIG